MKKIYQKSEIWFAIIWIIIYVFGASAADSISKSIGLAKVITLPFLLITGGFLLIWIKKNGLMEYYGLCKTPFPAKKFLYWIPLFVIFSINLWFGVTLKTGIAEAIVYVCFMLCVGFVEEIIFRGLLFKAMSRDNIKSAVIVSSVTFGLGHIVNLINGNGELLPTILQICYAIAVGFLFVVLFYRGKSLIPCILAHSINNALSTFANKANITDIKQIWSSAILCILSVAYALIIMRNIPNKDDNGTIS